MNNFNIIYYYLKKNDPLHINCMLNVVIYKYNLPICIIINNQLKYTQVICQYNYIIHAS